MEIMKLLLHKGADPQPHSAPLNFLPGRTHFFATFGVSYIIPTKPYMSTIPIPIINQSPHPLPHHQTPQSAGVDLRAQIKAPLTLAPLERKLIPTGLYMALPAGYEAQVRPRSGLAYKHGITVLNSPGTIDADYRGELKVLLINFGKDPYTIHDADRIAQLVVAPYTAVHWQAADTLPDSSRGAAGYGSTGK